MLEKGLSIAETAKELGVSTRTVRRFIKAGKLKAELVQGNFGPEYRISEIPAEIKKHAAEADSEEREESPSPQPQAQIQVQPQPPAESPDKIITMLKELQEKNMMLAAQLGAATERIRNLENQVKLLTAPATSHTAPKKSWWQRLIGLFGKGKSEPSA